MRNRGFIATAVLFIVAGISCGGGQRIEIGSIYEMVAAPVDRVEITSPILTGEAARLTVKGIFEDACTVLDRYITAIEGGTVDITVYAKRSISGCDAAPTPFEGNYYLSGLASGVYTVRVNDDDTLTVELAVVQSSGADPVGTECEETRLGFDPESVVFPDTVMEGQDLTISVNALAPDTCTTFSGIDAAVEGTGIVLSINGQSCRLASACQEILQYVPVEQRILGLARGVYAVFINGTNVGVVRVLEVSQCAVSLAPVAAVGAPASIREGESCVVTVSGSMPENFSLAPFAEARTEGAVAITLEMYGCAEDPSGNTPFETSYGLSGLAAGTWVIGVNDMASAAVAVLPACERRFASIEFADIYSSLWESGNGQEVPVGTPIDAVVGGTFPNGCFGFDGFEYVLEGTTIALNAMALYCSGVCGDKPVDFRETYTILGLGPGHYTITINTAWTFEFDVVE
ncbi:MAG: hypothetical protein HY897_25195 [Deltaproteobacteria bacterium]|nr:hypothetical protein [Deltaproteobacteria bacterium]